ncbi:MAG: hypothetical protein WCL14_07300 [Bacteroidota bacterium]
MKNDIEIIKVTYCDTKGKEIYSHTDTDKSSKDVKDIQGKILGLEIRNSANHNGSAHEFMVYEPNYKPDILKAIKEHVFGVLGLDEADKIILLTVQSSVSILMLFSDYQKIIIKHLLTIDKRVEIAANLGIGEELLKKHITDIYGIFQENESTKCIYDRYTLRDFNKLHNLFLSSHCPHCGLDF